MRIIGNSVQPLILAMVGVFAVACGGDDDEVPPGGQAGAGTGGSVQGGEGGEAGDGEGGEGEHGGGGGRSGAGSGAMGGEGGGTDAGQGGQAGDETGGASGVGGGGAGGASGAGTGGVGGSSGAGTGGVGGSSGAGTGGVGGSSGAGTGGGGAGAGGSSGSGGGGCTGAPTPGCACITVAPDGDDALASASDGALAFQSVQSAIDFASSNPDVPKVCVAAGAACGAAHYYPGPSGGLRMRDGISVYGNYASSGWARCADSETHLVPATADGVIFGSDIDTATDLDGFHVDQLDSNLSIGITVDGARGARIIDVRIAQVSGTRPEQLYGISLSNGAEAEILGVSVDALLDGLDRVGIFSVGSRVVVDAWQGQESSILAEGLREVSAVWLEDSPNSRIENARLEAAKPDGDATGDVVAVSVVGDAEGVIIRGNEVSASFGPEGTTGLSFANCAGTEPLVGENTVTAMGPVTDVVQNTQITGIAASGDCSVRIEGNTVSSQGGYETQTHGIRCNGRCRVRGNTVSVANRSTLMGTTSTGVAVRCDGCSEVSSNQLTGLMPTQCFQNCAYWSTGLVVIGATSETTLVDGNVIDGGCSGSPTGINDFGSIGIVAADNVRIQNNEIFGGGICPTGTTGATSAGIYLSEGAVDVHSNLIDGGVGCKSAGIAIRSDRDATIRNNIIRRGTCATGANIEELYASSAPSVLEYNDLVPSNLGPILYRDQGGPDASTAAEVNAMTSFVSFGNFSVSCTLPLDQNSPCVDAGTPIGAPEFDRDGDARTPSSPDVGPDEWGDLALGDVCSGVVCSGPGTCARIGREPRCICSSGYGNPPGDPLACVDVDACAADNGGCDPLTTCTDTLGGRTCGACPSGYSGTGESGCSDIDECQSNNGGCDPLVSCTNQPGGRLCGNCPSGYSGTGQSGCTDIDECQWVGACDPLTSCTNTPGGRTCGPCPDGYSGTGESGCVVSSGFLRVSAGGAQSCAVRLDGSLACWGYGGYYWGSGTAPVEAFLAVAAGSQHTCGLRADGTLVCWGENNYGVGVPPSGTFTAISTGVALHTCAIRTDGTLACWGFNVHGQATPPSGSFERVAVSTFQSCGIRTGGALACWGSPDGDVLTEPSGTFTDVAVGIDHACAVRADNALICWGTAALTPPAGSFEAIAICDDFVDAECAIETDGTLACFGENNFGQLDAPTGAFESVSIGALHACGVRTDGALLCWGSNSYGQASPPPDP